MMHSIARRLKRLENDLLRHDAETGPSLADVVVGAAPETCHRRGPGTRTESGAGAVDQRGWPSSVDR